MSSCWKCGTAAPAGIYKFCVKCGAKPQAGTPTSSASPSNTQHHPQSNTSPSVSPSLPSPSSTPTQPASPYKPPVSASVKPASPQAQSKPANQPAPQRAPVSASGQSCPACGKGFEGLASGVNAIGHLWHKDCWKCSKCGNKLFSFSRFLEVEGKPVCATCAKGGTAPSSPVPSTSGSPASQAKICGSCKKPIESQYVRISLQDYHPQCWK